MLLIVDRHNGIPVYRQIMDQIRFQTASGILKPGSALPSTRSLASELGLNPMTISKAYGHLEREGLLERRPGRSLIVRGSGDPADRTAKLEELRRALDPIVTVVRQLELPSETVIQTLEAMLDDGPSQGESE